MTRAAERHDGRCEGLDERAVLLAAGLAELVVTTVGSAAGSAWGTLRGLLRRSDASELVAEAGQELTARGRLVLDRYTAQPPAHLETLARHALARQAATDDV
ncbi:polyprenyl synthetase [Streptomyces sp. STR69]|uniref:polyprenyl synthetase n=1 Tax=Streptomyces sp. STR69 TaxID=1796942 RepID=UPI0021C71398|nr:polyprenyl synthetase [Streptomyces sp. STR69]